MDRQRGVFPLPQLFGAGPEIAQNLPSSRRSRCRLRNRLSVDARCEAAVHALNILAGHDEAGVVIGAASAHHLFVKEHILDAVCNMGVRAPDLTPAEAFGELRGASIYEDDSAGSVMPLDLTTVSLPAAGSNPVKLSELYGPGGIDFVQEFVKSSLAKTDEVKVGLAAAPFAPYMDDNLRSHRSAYVSFVRRLVASGMVELVITQPKEMIGFFGVKKKGGKVRLVIDCRRANSWFSKPRHVQLATGSAFSQMAFEPGESFYVAHFDIQNAFYSLELPEDLRDYFCCPSIHASELGVRKMNGHALGPGELLVPRLKILPMGWNHALWWCQILHRRILETRGGFAPEKMIIDRGPVPDTSGACYTVYVDNTIVIGTNRAEVDAMMQRGLAAVRAAGLPVHEVCSASTQAEVLGWQFNGSRCLVSGKPSRMWRLQLAIQWILAQPLVRGKDVEKLVGHCTFMALIRRPALAILSRVYPFINRHRDSTAVPLWASVRAELSTFASIIPLLRAQLDLPISDKVYCTDASEWGYGLVSQRLSLQSVGQSLHARL